MLYNQNGYTIPDSPAGVPLIGYRNAIVNYTAAEAAAGHPASNMGNPSTTVTWQSTTAGNQRIVLSTNGAMVNYLAIARHSLFDTTSSIALSYTDNADSAVGNLRALLHFEGTNAATIIQNDSGTDEPWAVNGSAQISTAQFKFGTSALLLNGTTDYLTSSGVPFIFGTAPFTIDCWIRLNAIGALQSIIDLRPSPATSGLVWYIDSSNHLTLFSFNATRITGTTALAANTWYHVALCRSGGNTRIFLNGVQEGSTYADANDYNAAATAGTIVVGATFDLAVSGHLNGYFDEFRAVANVGYFSGTFTLPTVSYPDGALRIFANFSSLLHFDGVSGSTVLTDSGGENHTWLARAAAHIDNAQSKFGGTSCFIGTNDFISGDGSDSLAFGIGDFTIDFWIRVPNVSSTLLWLYLNDPTNFAGNINLIIRNPTGLLEMIGICQGTTAVTVNTWHHIAVCRASQTMRVFLDGVIESTMTVTDTRNLTIGPGLPYVGGAPGGPGGLNGWIDELRIIKGTALFTRNFVPPQKPAGFRALGGKLSPPDTAPIIFRFATISPQYLVLDISPAFTAPLLHSIGVIYAGQLMPLERSVKVDVQHKVINHARKSSIVSGMEEKGQFLGRRLLAEWRESNAEFAWFTPAWYRTNFEPFVAAAVETPFFWAWNPNEYPAETAYAWLADNVKPETDPITRRVAATISMRALA